MPNLQNLKPYKPGESGNILGRPRGIKNISTIIKQLLADEELMDAMAKNKPGYWDKLPNKNGANALVAAMMIKAMQGDSKAATWISKYGFGDKIDITSDGERIEMAPVIVSEIIPRIVENAEAETQTTTDDTAS